MRLLLITVIFINHFLHSFSFVYDYWTKNGAYSITLWIGTPPHKQQQVIDQVHPISLSSLLYFNSQNSNTSQILNDTLDTSMNYYNLNSTANGSIISDIFLLKLRNDQYITINEFPFIYYNHSNFDPILIQNPISFAYSFPNSTYSFIHELHRLGYISKLTYSFIPASVYFGKVFIGEELENEIRGLNNASCKINTQKYYWGCKLNHINLIFPSNKNQINTNDLPHYVSYENNDEVVFQVGLDYILAPKTFQTWIASTIFDKFVQLNECYMFAYMDNEYYRCLCDVVNYFPEVIEFVIDNYSFRLINDKVFLRRGRYCDLQLAFNGKNKEDKWILGSMFMSGYISTFDYDKGQVFFYSNETFKSDHTIAHTINLNYINKLTIKILHIGVIICSIIPMMLLINQMKNVNKII